MSIITIQDNRLPNEDTFLNPKQELFLKYYLDPNSETFSNATQSGIKAGFSPGYANNLTTMMPTWLEETVGDARRVRLAEDNLLQLMTQDEDMKVKADMTKFVASTLGKKKYSTKQDIDVTSKGESILGINYIMPADSKVITEEHIIDAEVKPEEIKTEIIPNEG